MRLRHTLMRPMAGIAFGLIVSAGAHADSSHDRTQFGHNITIGPNEEVSDATCFGCSIRIRGHVSGDVTTFGGAVVLEDTAEVDGDMSVFGGSVRLDKNVKVGGDVSVFGGRVRKDPEATVGGDVSNFSSPGWLVLIFVVPLLLFGGFVAFIIWLVWRLIKRPSLPQPA